MRLKHQLRKEAMPRIVLLACARAFSDDHKAVVYHILLNTFASFLDEISLVGHRPS